MLAIVATAAVAGTFLSWSAMKRGGDPLTTGDVSELPADSLDAVSEVSAPRSWTSWLKKPSTVADPDDYFAEGILPSSQSKTTSDDPSTQNRASTGAGAAAPSRSKLYPRLVLPKQVTPGTVVWVGGDPSLMRLSQLLRYEFKRRFPGSEVDVRMSSTEASLKGVLDGSLDVAAISRSLTPDEEAEGLIAVPLARHKIAVLVGTENPFDGSITNRQFAQILSGQITNWSQVGGPDQPLRLVDRAAGSATRQALLSYPIFAKVNALAGAPAGRSDRLSDVAASLSVDGITYALIDQVSDDITNPGQVSRNDVKIVPLHQVLPDDPRYSISQPMVYVYKGPKPSPEAEAFLSYATVLRKRGLLADGASLKARGSLLDNAGVRWALFLLAAGAGVAALSELRQGAWAQKLLGQPSSAPGRGSAALRELEFYDDRASTYIILDAPSPDDRRSGELQARWMLADGDREKLPLESGGVLELRLYEYRAQEAIATNVIARHRPFRAYTCDGPEGEMYLSYHNRHHGARYLAELGYLGADNRWVKVATSEAVRPVAANTFSPILSQGWTPVEG